MATKPFTTYLSYDPQQGLSRGRLAFYTTDKAWEHTRERMQINGQMISEDEVVDLLPKIYEMCIKHDIPATFFESKWTMDEIVHTVT